MTTSWPAHSMPTVSRAHVSGTATPPNRDKRKLSRYYIPDDAEPRKKKTACLKNRAPHANEPTRASDVDVNSRRGSLVLDSGGWSILLLMVNPFSVGGRGS